MGEVMFWVPGVPVPKGSARAFKHPRTGAVITVQDNAERQRPWASRITTEAQRVGVALHAEGGVSIRLVFRMPRPKGHRRANGEIKPSAPAVPSGKPDLDKLVRCVLDALTGYAWRDDSQVTTCEAVKRFEIDKGPGVEIAILEECFA